MATNVAIDALSKFLDPVNDEFGPIGTINLDNAETEKFILIVGNSKQQRFNLGSNLVKLELNGVIHDNLRMEVLVSGNILSGYKAPYRFASNVIELHLPAKFGVTELDIIGFEGTILVTKLKSESVNIPRLFYQYSGRYKFTPFVTDLMMENKEPIDLVKLNFTVIGDEDGTYNTSVELNKFMLDTMYTKFTGKPDRPKNFAICSVKEKPLKLNPRLELASVLINDAEIDKTSIHYHTYDVFIQGNGWVVNRYSY